MRGTGDSDDLLFDPEIERTARRLRKLAKQHTQTEVVDSSPREEKEMAGNNQQPEEPLMDSILTPIFNRPNSSIVRPTIAANNWEIKPALIQLVERAQFGGEDSDDPHAFIDRFLMICDTTKHNGVTDDAIRLRLFPFAVKGKALRWVEAQPAASISTWEDLVSKFFAQFFSMEKFNQLVNEITNFTQQDEETFCAAWNRFKELMRKCPQYEMDSGDKVRIFFNGITPASRMVLNGAAGGTIRRKTATQTLELIESLARNENESAAVKSRRGVLHLESNDAVLAEQKLISQQIANLTARFDKFQAKAMAVVCEYCKGNHESNECPTLMGDDPVQPQVNGIWYDQRPQQNFQKSQNFAAGSNVQRRTQGGGLDYTSNNFLQPPAIPPKEPSELEKLVAQMAQNTNAFMEETRAQSRNQDASIRNLENQIGQLAKQISERLPSNNQEHCMSISESSVPPKLPEIDPMEYEAKLY